MIAAAVAAAVNRLFVFAGDGISSGGDGGPGVRIGRPRAFGPMPSTVMPVRPS